MMQERTAVPQHYAAAAARLWKMIGPARRIVSPFHVNADPDAVGSALGAYHLLTAAGKEVTVIASDGGYPAFTGFLPGAERIVRYRGGPLPEADLLLALDSSNEPRLGDLYAANAERFAAGPTVVIDHHVTNTRFGTDGANFVDADAAATAEMLYLLARAWRLPVTIDAATALLAGVYGDTLGLQTGSTTARTLRVAADLRALGADLTGIVHHFYRSRPFSAVKLWGLVVSRATWCGATLWSEVTPEVLAEAGAREEETAGIINFLTGTECARVTVLLHRGTDSPDEWRCSLRTLTEEVDVAAIAARFGGGGHPKAAGCRIAGGEAERDAFLREVDALAAGQVSAERGARSAE